MRAVVEAALRHVGAQIGHQPREAGDLDVLQSELLEPRRIDQRAAPFGIQPVPLRGRGRVTAGLQRARDLADLRAGVGHDQVDQRTLPGAARSEQQRLAPLQQRQQAATRRRGIGLERELHHLEAHRTIGMQALARRLGLRQVDLVQSDQRRDVGTACSDQRACELRLAEHRLAGDDHQQLVDVGGKRLGAPLVLAGKDVDSRFELLDDPLGFAGGQPPHPVADHAFALLAAWSNLVSLAVGRFDQVMATMRRHHETVSERVVAAQANSASMRAAQMKSLAVMPRAECVS
jgi:hypothetical protein